MPKGSRRKFKADRGRWENLVQMSEDDDCDNASMASNYSGSVDEGNVENDDDIDHFEDKLIEALDGLTQKCSQGRIKCLNMLAKALCQRHVPCFVKDRHFTFCDSLERCLKKGSYPEKTAAAALAATLCVQFGDDAMDYMSIDLRTLLINIACDKIVPVATRAKCCQAVGVIGYVCDNDVCTTLGLMQQLSTIFSASYLKGDGTVQNNITAEMGTLHASALNAWALLLTKLSGNVYTLMSQSRLPNVKQLAQLLSSAHLDVRMSTGEILALICEECRENADNYDPDNVPSFCSFDNVIDDLKGLATDSNKYRAKKDRKQQRATFRDILRYIEQSSDDSDDQQHEMQVRFGREKIMLDTWAKRKQYEELCQVLGSGINSHLAENEMVRNQFDIVSQPGFHINGMGLTAESKDQMQTQQHLERQRKKLRNAANYKARTIMRAKNRDKRSDF